MRHCYTEGEMFRCVLISSPLILPLSVYQYGCNKGRHIILVISSQAPSTPVLNQLISGSSEFDDKQLFWVVYELKRPRSYIKQTCRHARRVWTLMSMPWASKRRLHIYWYRRDWPRNCSRVEESRIKCLAWKYHWQKVMELFCSGVFLFLLTLSNDIIDCANCYIRRGRWQMDCAVFQRL